MVFFSLKLLVIFASELENTLDIFVNAIWPWILGSITCKNFFENTPRLSYLYKTTCLRLQLWFWRSKTPPNSYINRKITQSPTKCFANGNRTKWYFWGWTFYYQISIERITREVQFHTPKTIKCCDLSYEKGKKTQSFFWCTIARRVVWVDWSFIVQKDPFWSFRVCWRYKTMRKMPKVVVQIWNFKI